MANTSKKKLTNEAVNLLKTIGRHFWSPQQAVNLLKKSMLSVYAVKLLIKNDLAEILSFFGNY